MPYIIVEGEVLYLQGHSNPTSVFGMNRKQYSYTMELGQRVQCTSKMYIVCDCVGMKGSYYDLQNIWCFIYYIVYTYLQRLKFEDLEISALKNSFTFSRFQTQ